MSEIKEAEILLNRIEAHTHYGKCLKGDKYYEFDNNRNKYNNCRKCYNELENVETQIINEHFNKRNSEKKLNNLKKTYVKDLEIVEKKLTDMEKITLEDNQNALNNLRYKYIVYNVIKLPSQMEDVG